MVVHAISFSDYRWQSFRAQVIGTSSPANPAVREDQAAVEDSFFNHEFS
jgi:hypothetical protein